MKDRYDIIIIGSGLSGLICGYTLSKAGYKVCVLEKNKQVGGCLQTFSRDKCIFDVGVHYIGGLGKGQALNQYFRYLNIMDDLKLERMDLDAFDIISFEGDERAYKLAQGYDNFEASLIEDFPHEKDGIQKYTNALKNMCSNFPLYNLDIHKPYPKISDHLKLNAKQHIDQMIKDPTLRAVLGGNNILYGGKADKTPFYLHAMVLNSYIESSWRCIDGGSQIAKLLVQNIRAHGGTILKRKEVEQFVFNGHEISAVQLKDGALVYGKTFISSVHPSAIQQFLQGKKTPIRKAFFNRINNIEATPSVFSVHYTLKENTVEYINSNFYHCNSKKVWSLIEDNQKNWPSTYLALTPRTSKSDQYADSFSIMTYMDYKEVTKWSNTFNIVGQEEDRGSEYADFKEEKSALLLNMLYKKFPQLKGNIKAAYSSSPLSFRDYIGSPTGSMYGFEKNHQDPMRTAFSTNTKSPNLFLTGQNINVHGLLGVTVSGILTCMNFIERHRLLKDITSA